MRWVDYGGYLFEKRRKKEALDAYDEALAILGERASPQFLFKHADALILAGRYDDALAIAGRTPIEVHAPMIRGRVAFERHDFDQAIKELDGAALLWPDNAPIRYYLARSHEGVGDFDRAVEEYRQAMRADPTLSAVRERLARLHLAEGRVRHASTILSFVSPRKASEASTEMRLLEIEVNARLGLETRLAVPPTPELPPEVVRRRAMHALSRGLRMQSDPLAAERFLATLEKEIKSSSERNLFLRERVNLLLAGRSTRRSNSQRSAPRDNPRISMSRWPWVRHSSQADPSSRKRKESSGWSSKTARTKSMRGSVSESSPNKRAIAPPRSRPTIGRSRSPLSPGTRCLRASTRWSPTARPIRRWLGTRALSRWTILLTA